MKASIAIGKGHWFEASQLQKAENPMNAGLSAKSTTCPLFSTAFNL
jgi:hypothetical protein